MEIIADNKYTIRFATSGTDEVTGSVKSIQQAMRTLQASVNANMNMNSFKSMGRVLDAQKQKLNLLEKEVSEAKKALQSMAVGSSAWVAQTAKIGNLERQINKTKTQIASTEKELERLKNVPEPGSWGAKMRASINALKPAAMGAQRAIAGIAKIGKVVDTAALAAPVKMYGEAIKTAGQNYNSFRALQTSFDFAGYSSKQFGSAKQFIQDYAAKTEYSVKDMSQAWMQMGLDGSKASKSLMTGLGGIAQMADEPSQALNGILTQVSQMQTKGKLMYQDWSIITQYLGKPVADALEKSMRSAGAFKGSFSDAMSNGEISAEEFNAAVREVGNDKSLQKMATDAGSLKGAWSNAVEGVSLALKPLVEKMMPQITNAINQMGNVLEGMTNKGVAMWNGLGNGAQQMVAKIALAVTGFTMLAPAINPVITLLQSTFGMFRTFGTVIKTIGVAFGALSAPMTIAVVAIAALTAGLALFFTQTSQGRAAWDGLVQAFSNFASGIAPILQTAIQGIQGMFQGLITFVQGFITGLTGLFSGNTDQVIQGWQMMFEGIGQFLVGAFQTLGGLIGAALATIWQGISTAFSALWSIVVAALQPIINFFASAWNSIASTAGAIWSGIVATLSGIWNGIVSAVAGFASGVVNVVVSAWSGLTGIISGIWSGITSVISAGINFVRSIVSSGFNAVRSIASVAWNGVRAVIGSVWGAIRGVVSSGVNAVRSIATSGFNAVRSVVSSAMNAAASAVGSAIGRIRGLIGQIPGVIGSIAGAAFSAAANIGRSIWNGITSALSGLAGHIHNIVSSAVHSIGGKIGRIAASMVGFSLPVSFAGVDDATMRLLAGDQNTKTTNLSVGNIAITNTANKNIGPGLVDEIVDEISRRTSFL